MSVTLVLVLQNYNFYINCFDDQFLEEARQHAKEVNFEASSMEPAASTNISKPRKGHVSGPIYGSGRGDEMKLRRPTSGPITNLFNPINRGEDEISYMCLDQINNNSHHVKSYGPVYLVT